MRKVVLLMHVSLDGMVAGPDGDMDWVITDDEMWAYVDHLTADADTNLFGRVTYQMMESYWPTAAEQPAATRHDIDHARWVNAVSKVVFSTTLEKVEWQHSRLVRGNVAEEITNLKQQPGKNMIIIGSPSFAATLMNLGLVDEYWLNVNPVVLGRGKPLFSGLQDRINLKLVSTKTFSSGVVGLCYQAASA